MSWLSTVKVSKHLVVTHVFFLIIIYETLLK